MSDVLGHVEPPATPADRIALIAMSVVLAVILVLTVPGGGDGETVSAGPGGLAKLAITSLTPTEAAQSASRRLAPIGYELTAALPVVPEEAAAYRLRRRGRAAVEELRDALGLQGPVRSEENAFVVDDERLNLRVELSPGMPWALFQGVEQPLCTTPPGAAPGDAEFISPDCIIPVDPNAPVTAAPASPVPTTAPSRPSDLPTKAAAEAAGRKILTRIGVDLSTATVVVTDGYTTWDLTVEPTVGGLPVSGMSWSLGIGPAGRIVRGNGWLADPTKSGTYPLVSGSEAFERLKAASGGDSRRPTSTTVLGQPHGDNFRQPLTSARLGLALETSPDAGTEAHLVPVVLFRTSTGQEIPVVAVAEDYLRVTGPRDTVPGS